MSFMQHIFACALLMNMLYSPSSAWAHALGQGYVFMDVSDAALSGRIELTLTDLNIALDIDDDGDGKVSEQELEAHLERVKTYIGERIRIGSPAGPFPLEFTSHEIQNLPLGQFLWVHFEAQAIEIPDVLSFRYDALFDKDPLHRGFLVIERNDKIGKINDSEEVSLIFNPESGDQLLDVTRLSAWSSFVAFLEHGIWHIWIGFDHILFILALILPSVMRRPGSSWEPVDGFRAAFWNVFKIVTLFTVAHTVTLTLASLDLVRLPSRFVEVVIAGSVVFAALNNIFPLTRDRIGWVVFGFGLFHGFGFASVLQHLVANASNLAANLAGFNIGVEIGQIAIVAVVFPICFALRAHPVYRGFVLRVGSGAIALFALGWLIERVADLEFMPL